MSHILQPPSEKTFTIADVRARNPRCVMLVESAILALIDAPQDDQLRHTARDLVRTLSTGCPECGFKEPPKTLRKLTSLLAVSPTGSAALRQSVAERLIEQVGLLKEHARGQKR